MNQQSQMPQTTQQLQANMTLPGAGRAASQSTLIEQSRAVAEVQGAIVSAKNSPRDVTGAMQEMQQSCNMIQLAERAFFSFNRGGSNVQGATIHLATELARCWGNIDYGIKELNRDDSSNVSEMLAFAWDLQTNTRAETTFIVPHKRAGRNAPTLIDMRDIYENNANNGARRLREMIFRVLPPWYVEDARERCHKTLREGGGKPLKVRIPECIKAFEGMGVSRKQIEARLGHSVDEINDVEMANLEIIFKSIQRGEAQKDDEFPPIQTAEIEQAVERQKAEAKKPAAKPKAKDKAADKESVKQEGGKRPDAWPLEMELELNEDNTPNYAAFCEKFEEQMSVAKSKAEIEELWEAHQDIITDMSKDTENKGNTHAFDLQQSRTQVEVRLK